MVSEHANPLAVLGGDDAGGQNVYVAELSRTLAEHGHKVIVYTRADAPSLPRRMTMSSGVIVEHIIAGPLEPLRKDDLFRFMTTFRKELSNTWSTERPDLVHAHFWMSGLAAVPAARQLAIPVVQTFHALGLMKRKHQGAKDTSPPQRLGVERTLARTVDHIVAMSTQEALQLLKLGADRGRVSLVPSGVNTSKFCPDGPSAMRTSRPRILTVGRLVRRKGFEDIIRALATIPEAELLIVGGPSRDMLDEHLEVRRLREQATECQVSDRVQFVGRIPQDEMPLLYRSADVVISYPWYEPFGIVPLEAMACGVPVVVSRVGGMTDTVIHGHTGQHVAPRRPDLLGHATRMLLADRSQRAVYGTAGRRRMELHYDWDQVVKQMEQVYSECISNSSNCRTAHH